jgi:prepilin-type N-terminal cleavage/methylation domain-containing protein
MKNTEKGFTLAEVLVAGFVITVGAAGAYALANQTISLSNVNENRLVASYLAQEGVEIVRNIRDTNYVQIFNGDAILWTEGNLNNCAAGCYVSYGEDSLNMGADSPLYTSGQLTYSHAPTASLTPFTRTITIVPNGPDILEVNVQVEWSAKGKSYEVSAATELHNWYP